MNKFIKIKFSDGFDRYINLNDITEIQFQQWEQKNVKTDETEMCHAYYIYTKNGTGSASITKEEFEILLKNIEIIN